MHVNNLTSLEVLSSRTFFVKEAEGRLIFFFSLTHVTLSTAEWKQVNTDMGGVLIKQSSGSGVTTASGNLVKQQQMRNCYDFSNFHRFLGKQKIKPLFLDLTLDKLPLSQRI